MIYRASIDSSSNSVFWHHDARWHCAVRRCGGAVASVVGSDIFPVLGALPLYRLDHEVSETMTGPSIVGEEDRPQQIWSSRHLAASQVSVAPAATLFPVLQADCQDTRLHIDSVRSLACDGRTTFIDDTKRCDLSETLRATQRCSAAKTSKTYYPLSCSLRCAARSLSTVRSVVRPSTAPRSRLPAMLPHFCAISKWFSAL